MGPVFVSAASSVDATMNRLNGIVTKSKKVYLESHGRTEINRELQQWRGSKPATLVPPRHELQTGKSRPAAPRAPNRQTSSRRVTRTRLIEFLFLVTSSVAVLLDFRFEYCCGTRSLQNVSSLVEVRRDINLTCHWWRFQCAQKGSKIAKIKCAQARACKLKPCQNFFTILK